MTFSTAQLNSLKVPTLLIWGKADRIFPKEAAYFKAHLPADKTAVFEPEHFTHSPYLEAPMGEQLSQITLHWLNTL